MPPRAAPGGAAQPARKDWKDTATGLVRTLAMFFAVQTAMKYGMSYMGMTPAAKAPTPLPVAGTTAAAGVQAGAAAMTATPAWDVGTPMSMFFYLSTAPTITETDLSVPPLLVWDGLTYGDWKDAREADVVLDVPASVRAHNGSWYMDILLVKGGGTEIYDKKQEDVAALRKELTRWMPKRKIRKEKKLIGGDDDDANDEPEPETDTASGAPIIAHWSRNLTISVVSDQGTLNLGALQPTVQPYIRLAPLGTGEKKYFPTLYPNDFWILRENLLSSPINASTARLPLRLTYAPISNLKFNMYSAMTNSFEQAAQTQGSGAELDEMKRMLTETNPILLVTTALVTILHTLFEFLAFSADVRHYKKLDKNLVGVSLRTILTNCFVQLVILLYLHDSSEETSFMILLGQGIGLLIEAWKITKVINIRVRAAPGSLIGYRITFEDKHELSEEEKKSQEYDKLAFRLVSYFAIPMLAGYTVYSLLYSTHRSWYSFIISTLAQAIYAFGFVQLVPGLIMNYKLKSVAHLSFRTMVYKTLGTVVDDFFAFCIKMPWLHRLACFRDDVVFAILLWQRYHYRTDYSRVNEYGQVQQGMVEPVDSKEGESDKPEAKGKDGKSAESKKNK
ncbi:hypothetical protein Q5752_005576 [Cryptotrichosporon argae]